MEPIAVFQVSRLIGMSIGMELRSYQHRRRLIDIESCIVLVFKTEVFVIKFRLKPSRYIVLF